MGKAPALTATAGAPVADNQNSITAGPRGPVLLQDWRGRDRNPAQARGTGVASVA